MDKPLSTTATPRAIAPAGLRLHAGSIFWLAFIAFALTLLFRGAWFGFSPAAAQTLNITFVSIVLEALPFVALGALLGGLIEVFVSRETLTRLLPRNRTAAIGVAGLMGVLIPVCECAVIAVTRRLVRKGVPFSVAVAYLLAGPIVNPIVAASTWVAYPGNWEIVVLRLLCGYGVAVSVALVMDSLFSGARALLPAALAESGHHHDDDHAHAGCDHDHGDHHHSHGPHPPLAQRVLSAFGHAADDFLQISQYLIIGAFVAGLSQTLIPREQFVALAETPSAAITAMMTLAIALNLCSEADAFVAASYRSVMPPAAMLAFMVLGPMLDIKLIAMYLTFVRVKALIVLMLLLVTAVWLLMLTVHAVYGPTLAGAAT
jgi:uncharacterized membrane protein YraQ (UPF0718 family)